MQKAESKGSPMKVLCVGYPRTGTRSLWMALTILGFNALHHDDERVPLFPPMDFNFRVYDDVDAATEEIWWREVAEAYKSAKIILPVRDIESWWESVQFVVHENRCRTNPLEIDRFDRIQNLLYGCASPVERLYKTRYAQHIAWVREWCSFYGRELLTFAPTAGDGWNPLCKFLDVDVPDISFPWENKRT